MLVLESQVVSSGMVSTSNCREKGDAHQENFEVAGSEKEPEHRDL